MNNKRLISLLAAAAMVASITPTNILAEEINNNVDNIIVEGTNQGSDTTVDGVGDNATDSQKPDGTEEVMPESKSPKEILKEKINNAQNGATITLESNIEMGEETLVIPQGKEIVLDLAGYTISAAKGVKEKGFSGNVIENNGILTVKNGIVSVFNNNAGTYGSGIKNNGTLIIDEDTDKNTKVIGRTGIENFGTATVNAGIIASHNRNAYWGASTSNVVINGGIFTSPGTSGMGRAVSSEGKVDINAGEFYATGKSEDGDNYVNAIGVFNNAVLNIKPAEGKTVKVNSKTDYAVTSMNGAKINIYGGEFACEGDRVDVMKLQSNSKDLINIYGGTFKHNVYDEYVADGYVSYEKEGKYIVEKLNQIENVNVSTYSQLVSALNNPITLPKNINITSNIKVPNGKKLTLKNGFEINIKSGKQLTVDGILCLDGKLVNNGKLEVTDNGFIQKPLKISGNGEILNYPEVKDGVCKISTPMELQWISKMVEDGNTPKIILLENDINMPDVLFTPIGNSKEYADAEFNGKDNRISNIKINVNSEYKGGFFGYARDVEIKNLKINGTSTNSTSSYIGALVGRISGDSTIQNVHIEDYTVSSNISYGVGGFAGKIENGENKTVKFIGCSSNANVKGYANVGGFWGTSTGSKGNIEIYDCKLSGNIEAINVNGAICGGYGTYLKATIKGLDYSGINLKINGSKPGKVAFINEDYVNKETELKSGADIDRSKLAIKDGKWEENITNPKASLNGVKYADLFEAYNAAEKYDVLKLLDNIEL